MDLGSVNSYMDRPRDRPKWPSLCTLIKRNNYWDIKKKRNMVSRGNGLTLKLINNVVSTAKCVCLCVCVCVCSFIASSRMKLRSKRASK
jgi:hypothetical protein